MEVMDYMDLVYTLKSLALYIIGKVIMIMVKTQRIMLYIWVNQ